MSVRRTIVILACAIVGGFAVLMPSPSRDLEHIESAAPPFVISMSALEPQDETGMASLRLEASQALAQLRTRTVDVAAAH